MFKEGIKTPGLKKDSSEEVVLGVLSKKRSDKPGHQDSPKDIFTPQDKDSHDN